MAANSPAHLVSLLISNHNACQQHMLPTSSKHDALPTNAIQNGVWMGGKCRGDHRGRQVAYPVLYLAAIQLDHSQLADQLVCLPRSLACFGPSMAETF